MNKYFKNIFFFIFSFSVCFFMLEFFISKTFIVNKSINKLYNDIGRGRRANFTYIQFNEGFTIGEINSLRYLGPAYSKEKDSSTLRIALIGDSFVEGFQVFERIHFRTILEDSLSKILNKKVEVLNFGRSGFDIGDTYIYYETFVKKFNPDINLMFVSNAELHPLFSDPLRMKLKLVNDSLIITKNYPKKYLSFFNKFDFLIQNFAIFSMANNCYKLISQGKTLSILLDKLYYSKTNDAVIPKNLEIPVITEKIISTLEYPPTIIVNRDKENINSEFLNEIKKANLPFIDLNDTLNVLFKNEMNPYYWESTNKIGHWNQDAHKAIGLFLSKEINSLIKLQSNNDAFLK